MPTLLGPDGQPIRKQALTQELAGPTLTGVRQLVGDHPARGLTPQRLARLLRDAEEGDATAYLELAEDMEERDLHYLGVLGARKRAVAQLEVKVEPASDAAEDVANADLVEQWLRREELEDELFDVLDAVGKGYSVTEIVWETSERQWMPARLAWRQPQWFEVSRQDGRTLLLKTEAGATPLEPWKYVVHRVRAKSGLPIRGGLARAVAWAFLFKSYGLKDWVTFAEIYGQPLRVGKYHAGATAEEKRILLKAVAQLGTDAAAIIPEGMLIELVEARASGSTELWERMCDWLDRQVSKAVLGQTGTTELQGGSYAAAKVHDGVRGDIERADAKALAATLNRDLVRPLVDLNRGPQAWYPRIVIGRPEEADVPVLSEALARLVPLGLRVRQGEVRRKLGLADPDPADELLRAPATPPTDGAPEVALQTRAQSAANPFNFAFNKFRLPREGSAPDAPLRASGSLPREGCCPGCGEPVTPALNAAGAPARDRADQIADRLEVEAAGPIDGWLEQLRRLLDESGSLEEVAARLLELYPQLETAGLADAMGQALALAALAGRADMAAGEG